MTKRLLVRGRESRLDEVLALSAAMRAPAHTTPEHQASIAPSMRGSRDVINDRLGLSSC